MSSNLSAVELLVAQTSCLVVQTVVIKLWFCKLLNVRETVENHPCIHMNAVVLYDRINTLNGGGNCVPLPLTFHLVLRINSNTFHTRS